MLFVLLREYLSGFGAWYPILLGVVSIAVMLFEPRGLWGLIRRLGIGEVISVSHHPDEVSNDKPVAHPVAGKP